MTREWLIYQLQNNPDFLRAVTRANETTPDQLFNLLSTDNGYRNLVASMGASLPTAIRNALPSNINPNTGVADFSVPQQPQQQSNLFAPQQNQPQAQVQAPSSAPAQPDLFGTSLLGNAVPGSRFPTIPLQQEAPLFQQVSQLEQNDLLRAREQQRNELLANQGLFDEAGLQDQGEYQAAAQQALQQGNDLFNSNLSLAQSSLAPIFQEQLKKNAAALRAKQGLGAGGFDGSGAYQQLAGQNSTQLALEAYRQAFPGLFNAQQASQSLNTQGQLARQPYRQAGVQNRLEIGNLFANAGVNANLTPSQYRRDLFQRGLDENARLADVGGQYEFVDKQAGLANSAASAARKAGVNAALIGGLGAIGGGLASGYAANLFAPRIPPRTAGVNG